MNEETMRQVALQNGFDNAAVIMTGIAEDTAFDPEASGTGNGGTGACNYGGTM